MDTIGGGERLIQEGARYYRSLGHRVIIYTWHYDEIVLFHGEYEDTDIVCLQAPEIDRKNIADRAWSRLKTLPTLRRRLIQDNVSTVFVQGEYDVALAYLLTRFTKIDYRFLVFGQMFQYPHDNAKYALVFRKHLKTIINSYQGYKETTPTEPPRLSLPNRLANEFIALVRYRAVRTAEKAYTFSRQVQWETQTLFGVTPEIARGGFREALVDNQPQIPRESLAKFGLEEREYFLSFSRLDRKKRIDISIHAMAQSGLQNTVLAIAGGGEDRTFLEEEAARCAAPEKIVFLGRVDEADVLALKKHASFLVSMDIGDFDISPLEALALGTPVICAREFDADEAIRSLPGFHSCDATTDALREAMVDTPRNPLPADPDDLKQLSWEKYYDRILS